MTTDEIAKQLESLSEDKDFESRSNELVNQWNTARVGPEAVEPVLRFMERHPRIDYGAPGPLVSFIERSFRAGGALRQQYVNAVLESIQRIPTAHTAWLLNRIVNVTNDPETRCTFLKTMKDAFENPGADENARRLLAQFIIYQTSREAGS